MVKKRPRRGTTRVPQKLKVKIGKLELENPVILASGTAGFGREIREFLDIERLGAIVTKTITLHKKEGNPPPRVVEAPWGLLNSIGLANGGIKDFMFEQVPFLESLRIPVIASISGDILDEFIKLAEEVSRVGCVRAIEVNLSCPNVIHKGTRLPLLAQDRTAVEKIVSTLRKTTEKTLIPKLSPNVTDIKEIAKAAEGAGCDAVSLVNTYPAMLVDIHTMRPRLGNVCGGLSGPCIKPLALKCVWDVHSAIDVPVIGMGGIMDADDAIEFILCGSSAVQVGTANFVNPSASLGILEGIEQYMAKKGIADIMDLVGAAKA